MKRIVGMIALLSCTIAATASDYRMYFKVDFPFAVSGRAMPAGVYLLEATTVDGVALRLVHEATGKSTHLNLPASEVARSGPRAYPAIAFRCDHDACTVASVVNVRPGLVYRSWESLTPQRNLHYRTVALNAAGGK